MKNIIPLFAILCVSIMTACENGDETPIEIPKHKISITTPDGGDAMAIVDDKAISEASEGTVITLTATADEGYEFSVWTTANEEVVLFDPETSSTTFTMPAGDVIIEAQFISITAKGIAGELAWVLTEDGVLTFSGNGAIPDTPLFENWKLSPWLEYGSEIEAIEIEDGVTGIGEWAFAGTAIKSINLPDGVVSIGEFAFFECQVLTSITIPESVTSIGFAAFSHCPSLTSVTVMSTAPASLDFYGYYPGVDDNFKANNNDTLYVPKGCLDAYRFSDWYYTFEYIVEQE